MEVISCGDDCRLYSEYHFNRNYPTILVLCSLPCITIAVITTDHLHIMIIIDFSALFKKWMVNDDRES